MSDDFARDRISDEALAENAERINSAVRAGTARNNPAPAAAFRDSVIAGLRERGWPEPREQSPNGEFLSACFVWGSEAYPQVWLAKICDSFGYEAGDDQESGSAGFGDNTDAARIVEAIDRLRWVIGMPSDAEVDKMVRPPMGWHTALPQGHWLQINREIKPLPAPEPPLMETLEEVNRRIAKAFGLISDDAARRGLMVGEPLTPGAIRVAGTVDDPYALTSREIVDAALNRITRFSVELTDSVFSGKPSDAAIRIAGAVEDNQAGLVPLPPSKPAPKADPPYVPTRWIGDDG